MSVFICWSGERSHKLARAVAELVRTTLGLNEADIFVSDRIEKGVAWFDEIVKHLESSEVGIVCLTQENVESPWLHFESGALALRLEKDSREKENTSVSTGPLTPRNRLFTLLHGVTGAELKGPLGAYQATGTSAPEMAAMIQSIARILGKPPQAITTETWNGFKKELDNLAISARELIRELDSWFQRKTFDEPLHCCADQAWLRRYDGARQTRDRLSAHIGRVRAACSEHESSLFEMLVSEVDGYAMALSALLLTPKTFRPGDRGELRMDPYIRTSCEDRRLAVRSLVGRLMTSRDNLPLREEAVHFMGAETNEERKMIIHRLESAIRTEWEQAYEKTNTRRDALPLWRVAIRKLTGNRRPIDFRASSWDLDRIYYYLLVEYFRAAGLRWMPLEDTPGLAPGPNPAESGDGNQSPMPQDIACAARDVEMEVERYRAKSKGRSLTPLTYALVALQALRTDIPRLPADGSFVSAQTDVVSALNNVRQELAEVLKSDAGRALRRLMDEMLSDGRQKARAARGWVAS